MQSQLDIDTFQVWPHTFPMVKYIISIFVGAIDAFYASISKWVCISFSHNLPFMQIEQVRANAKVNIFRPFKNEKRTNVLRAKWTVSNNLFLVTVKTGEISEKGNKRVACLNKLRSSTAVNIAMYLVLNEVATMPVIR